MKKGTKLGLGISTITSVVAGCSCAWDEPSPTNLKFIDYSGEMSVGESQEIKLEGDYANVSYVVVGDGEGSNFTYENNLLTYVSGFLFDNVIQIMAYLNGQTVTADITLLGYVDDDGSGPWEDYIANIGWDSFYFNEDDVPLIVIIKKPWTLQHLSSDLTSFIYSSWFDSYHPDDPGSYPETEWRWYKGYYSSRQVSGDFPISFNSYITIKHQNYGDVTAIKTVPSKIFNN